MTRSVVRFVAIALLLGAIAAIARTPASADRDIYQTIGRQLFVLDCHDVHCYRILPAPILEHLPGPSLLKWKAYAVVANAAAAIAPGRLCLVLGLLSRAAGFATWISALGFGPLQSVFDPYTSDPVMYLLAPLEALPDALCWPFVIAFGVANLRLGQSQPAVSWLRGIMLVVSLALACVAVSSARRHRRLETLGAEAS